MITKNTEKKVIDIELDFDPTASESADIAFDPPCEHTKELPKFTEKLDIKKYSRVKENQKTG